MTTDLPDRASAVIIGGGVIGASVAWHLTDNGYRDVLVLERGQLGCGTTWHSAGNIIRMSADPATVGIYTYGKEFLSALHERQDIGWRTCGRVMVARTEARLRDFDAIAETLNAGGVPVEPVNADFARDKIPVMHTGDIVGALWSPDDGRVNPMDLTIAYMREARDKGAQLIEGVTVDRAMIENGRAIGVSTDRGDIRCDLVINCAGLWARDIGLRNGIAIPLYPVEHFYLLTETMEGVYPDMPTFRDPDGLIYGREEVGGLLLGCFDRDAIPVRPSDLPEPFIFALLNENWDQFGPYLQEGLHRIPALNDVGIKTLLNGPESFTPDSEPILDAAPEVENYYVLAGLSSAGVTRSAGMARLLANLIVEGDPGMDTSAFSLRRFPPDANDEDNLRRAVRDAPSGHFSIEQ